MAWICTKNSGTKKGGARKRFTSVDTRQQTKMLVDVNVKFTPSVFVAITVAVAVVIYIRHKRVMDF